MMRNKKMIFILLALVIIVWGTIVYRIYFTFNKEEIKYINTVKPLYMSKDSTENFTVVANYRDPFLDEEKRDKPQVATLRKPVVKPQQVNWPTIRYGGIIKNRMSSKQLVLLTVNGREKIIRVRENADGVILSKIFKDSVEVIYEKEKKVIRK
jgi:hypothetical protein